MDATRFDDDLSRAICAERAVLLALARRRLGDDALAEDLVQDTVLVALQGRGAFAGQAALRTWLVAILLKKIAEERRRARRAPVAAAPAAARDEEDFEPDAGPVDWHDPERLLAARQLVARLGEGLAALPATAARAVALRALDGLDTAEAARELALTPAQCALLLHRTRSRLRRHLEA